MRHAPPPQCSHLTRCPISSALSSDPALGGGGPAGCCLLSAPEVCCSAIGFQVAPAFRRAAASAFGSILCCLLPGLSETAPPVLSIRRFLLLGACAGPGRLAPAFSPSAAAWVSWVDRQPLTPLVCPISTLQILPLYSKFVDSMSLNAALPLVAACVCLHSSASGRCPFALCTLPVLRPLQLIACLRDTVSTAPSHKGCLDRVWPNGVQ